MIKKKFVKDEVVSSSIEEKLVSNITQKNLGYRVYVRGVIERIIQTSGPTIFETFDGTGRIPLKAFIAPGERAFPEIQEGDYVKAMVKIEEFNGALEGDVISFYKKEGESKEKIEENIKFRLKKQAEVKEIDFLIKSNILDKLKRDFINAATEIRLAILQARPIIVRHHNDTDGYSAGFALERAILPLVEKQHLTNPKAAWEYFTRSPCAAPYYEIEDSIKDTSLSLRNVAKFSNKMPLIIIVDNGSTQEDLMGILQGKIHGSEFIVVDHHKFDKDVITEHVLCHVNPFLVGESGASISAGMLCAELARFINPEVKNIIQIPALSGLADRIDIENEGIVNDYLNVAEKEGYSKELLIELSLVIDYVSTRIRFLEAREYFEVVFGEPRIQQKKLVELLAPYIKELDEKGLKIAKENAILKDVKGITLQKIMIEESFPGFGFFPKPGRSIGLVHDFLKSQGKKNLISFGVMNTSITFRATDGANFSVHDLIGFLQKNLPNAFVSGGGHKNAGAISYLPKYKTNVVELFEKFVEDRQ
jgi:archaea-specific RecJ-like exonuclease